MAAPLVWTDKVYVTITQASGTDKQYAAKTGDLTLGGGDQNIDLINVNSGQIKKRNRYDLGTMTFDNVVPLIVEDFRSNKEGNLTTSSTISVVTSGVARNLFRVALLWHNTTGVTSAVAAVPSGAYAYRITVKDADITAHDEKWTVGEALQGSFTLSFPWVDENGVGNVQWQSVTGNATLSSLSAYTGGNFG